ncbi:hypothetical protein KRR26_06775 [Corallococcus sp. M34]|uniref:hypothetical protein n=1 Tax=Citreicoccus inhibens TaxID=2849499 RepID=UPI001C24BD32|nr:hypothetical protein [Citreicoccus inhibens]MBU8895302.1 hypothetical protein [Citreicoccus inhibens]
MKEQSRNGVLRIFLDEESSTRAWSYRAAVRGQRAETGDIPTLDALAEVLGRHGALLTDLPWTELPTFGGPPPATTDNVWSWDAERLLVGTHPDSLILVRRDSAPPQPSHSSPEQRHDL